MIPTPAASDPPATPTPSGGFRLRRLPPPSVWLVLREKLIELLLLLAALSSVLITVGIVALLIYESALFFRRVPLTEFLFTATWSVGYEDARYGILPLVCGTLVTTAVALLVALPIGTVVAIYLSEYAPFALREVLKPVLELLSAVPTVIYGYFALLFVTPLLKKVMWWLPEFNMLSAGIVMGVMIIPYVSSLSEDAMRAVPALLREGSYALGANKLTTAVKVVFPAALSGIGAAYILGISRAVGETMIVAIAAGQQPVLTLNPTSFGETITAFIVRISQGDLPHGTIGYQSIFAAGLTLFVMTLLFNIAGWVLRKRFREAY
jgi:phosphate transport system permease protein